jgi:hypothetical protein
VDVLHESDSGYNIRLTRRSDGNERVFEQFIDRHLFDICVKTGFLSELAAGMAAS